MNNVNHGIESAIVLLLLQDIIMSTLLILTFITAGVMASYVSSRWRLLIAEVSLLSRFGIDVLIGLRDSLAGTAVSPVKLVN